VSIRTLINDPEFFSLGAQGKFHLMFSPYEYSTTTPTASSTMLKYCTHAFLELPLEGKAILKCYR
jgi:hypothetical protein